MKKGQKENNNAETAFTESVIIIIITEMNV